MKDREESAAPAGRKRCAKCGACTAVCPVYRATGHEIYSARGKQHLAEVYKERRPGPVFEDIYSRCLLCGACASVCPRKIDITGEVMAARQDFSPFYGGHGYQKYLARKVLNHPSLLGAARQIGRRAAALLAARLPADSGLRLRLAMFAEDGDNERPAVPFAPSSGADKDLATVVYYPGCAARYLYPEIIDDIEQLLAGYGLGLHQPDGLACCGLAMQAAGHPDEARRAARTTIDLLSQTNGPILVSCGSCYAQLARYEELFATDESWWEKARSVSERVVEISRFVEELLHQSVAPDQNQPLLRVFYHDPCHLRHGHSTPITAEPRAILRSLPQVELLELPDGPQCCGQGGLFHLGAPELAAVIRDDLARKISELAPDVITTTCSGCLMQLKTAMAAAGREIPVVHLARLVRSRTGGSAHGSLERRPPLRK